MGGGADLQSALDAFAAVDVASQPGSALLEDLDALTAATRLLAGQLSRRLRAAEQRDVTVGETGRTITGWLVAEALLPVGAARRLAGTARQLAALPAVAAAYEAGTLTEAAALVLARVAGEVPEADRDLAVEILLPVAQQAPFGDLLTAAVAVREKLGVDDGTDPAEAAAARVHGRRHLDLVHTFGGAWSLSGVLDPEAGQALVAALATRSGRCGPEDDRTAGQRRADAVGAVAAEHLARADASDDGPGSSQGGERPRVVVTMTLDQLLDALRHHRDAREAGDGGSADTCGSLSDQLGPASALPTLDGWSWLDSGLPLSAATARRLACDAEIIPAVLGGDGQVLDLGRTSRTWTLPQRRAAWLRAGGRCEAPACPHPPADLHHLHFWGQGGMTDLANAAWLCTFHHWLAHHTSWQVTRGPDGLIHLSRSGREGRGEDGRVPDRPTGGRSAARVAGGLPPPAHPLPAPRSVDCGHPLRV